MNRFTQRLAGGDRAERSVKILRFTARNLSNGYLLSSSLSLQFALELTHETYR